MAIASVQLNPTRNKRMIRRVADAIEAAPPSHFDMAGYLVPHRKRGHECGSTMCIAGYTVALSVRKSDTDTWSTIEAAIEKKYNLAWSGIDWDVTAMVILRIDQYSADDLFHRQGATQKQAVATLRHLADTGEVVWQERRRR